MYLFIMEDGDMTLKRGVEPVDMQMCDDGYVDIVDVSEANNPKRLWNGEWLSFEGKEE